ncbi:MAG: TIGR04255 family protein [Verrucomicrobia bacterium]|nr:TIGR04255 family protein [Verrucomicrobiota bacterium]
MAIRPTPRPGGRGRLPEYRRPPVNEVVLGVQFGELTDFQTVHSGLYWQTIRAQYPKLQERAPLSTAFEFFGDPVRLEHGVHVEQVPPLRRCWFLDESENRLVQLQPERFLHNWRKVTGEEEYPRYSSIKKSFEQLWQGFLGFVQTNEIGKIAPNQWEVTYVNHVYRGEGWDTLADLSDILACWSGASSAGYLPTPETNAVALSYAFPEQHGRLHVHLDLRFQRPGNKKLLRLELTARGKLDSDDPSDLHRCLDVGHEWIVWGFTDLTTGKAHKLWGRCDV